MKRLTILLVFILMSCNLNTKKESTLIVHQAELEFKTMAELGEGAIWNYQTQELFWVDIEGKTFNVYSPESNKNKTFSTSSRVGAVVPKSKKEVLVALEDGVHILDLDSGNTSLLTGMSQELKGKRLNDGKCDPAGRLWVGSMHFDQIEGEAKLYMIDEAGKYHIKKDSVTISNGIAWTSDKKTMYYIDTPTAQIKAYDYDDANGDITNERVVVEISNNLGFPDGMTIDAEDKLWVGMWNGNAVIRFDPITGKILEKIEVPAHNITSCAFGGENLDTLYITTARVDMTDNELTKLPLSGSIFKVVPGAKGVKSNFFNFN